MVNTYGLSQATHARFALSSTSTQWCKTRASYSDYSGSVYGSGFRSKSYALPVPHQCCTSSSGGFWGVAGAILGFINGFIGISSFGGMRGNMSGGFMPGSVDATAKSISDSIVASINSQMAGSQASSSQGAIQTGSTGQANGSAQSGQADGSAQSGQANGSAQSGQADGSAQSEQANGSAQSGQANGSAQSGQADGSAQSGQANGSAQSGQANGSAQSGQANGSAQSGQANGSGNESQGARTTDYGASRGWTSATAEDVCLYQGEFKVHDDVRGARGDISRLTCTMSEEVDSTSGFPLTIKVGPYSYKFERVQDGVAIYSSIGGSGDEYRLQKNSNGTFALNQYEGDKGAGSVDFHRTSAPLKQRPVTRAASALGNCYVRDNKYINIKPENITIVSNMTNLYGNKRTITATYCVYPYNAVTVKIEVDSNASDADIQGELKAKIEDTQLPLTN